GPHRALQPHVHLPFHKRLRHRELIPLDQRLQNLFTRLRGLSLLFRSLKIGPDLASQFLESRNAATLARRILRKFIIQFGQLLLFDSRNFNLVCVRLALQALVRIILRVRRFKLFSLANGRTAQILAEACQRLLRSDVAEYIIRLYRIAPTMRRSVQLDLRVIAVLNGAPFDRHKRLTALAQFLNRLVHLRVIHIHRIDLHFQILIVCERKLWQHLKDGMETQRLALFELHLIDLWIGHRKNLLFVERLPQILRHERLHHFAFNVARKPPPHQSRGRLARTKSRNARHTRDVPRNLVSGFLYIVRRNFQLGLALTGSFRGFSHDVVSALFPFLVLLFWSCLCSGPAFVAADSLFSRALLPLLFCSAAVQGAHSKFPWSLLPGRGGLAA